MLFITFVASVRFFSLDGHNIIGRLAQLSSTEIWKILSPGDNEQETPTSGCIIFLKKVYIYSLGVGYFAYYSGQAVSRASVG